MTNLGDSIRNLANQTYEASKPSIRMFGTVSSIDPLKIQVNEKFILENSLIVVTQTIKNYIDLKILEAGDTVIMTRQPGGQKYIVDDMVACDKDIRELALLNHTHNYVDDNWLAKAKKTTSTGKMVEEEE